MRRWGVTAVVVVGAAGVAGLALMRSPHDPDLIAGRQLYAEHCASCHGESLAGQPNWMERNGEGRLPAPPHDETGHTWHHSDRQLLTIVMLGLSAIAPGYQSDMPAFEGVLTEAEIGSVLAYIKSTWPARERAYQAARTRADPG